MTLTNAQTLAVRGFSHAVVAYQEHQPELFALLVRLGVRAIMEERDDDGT